MTNTMIIPIANRVKASFIFSIDSSFYVPKMITRHSLIDRNIANSGVNIHFVTQKYKKICSLMHNVRQNEHIYIYFKML